MTTDPEKDANAANDAVIIPAPADAHKPVLMKAPYDPDEEEEPHVCCTDPRHQHR